MKIFNLLNVIKQGGIYISGRGQGFKPIVVANADKLNITIYPIEDIMRAISIIFMVVKDYMLVSGKVESWFVIVEAKNTTAYKIPFNQLNLIFELLKLNFPCYLERVFILQPQTSIQITWQIVEQFIPYNSRHKVEFIDNDYSLLFNYIRPKQLEQRHGGRAPNVQNINFIIIIYDYWPPHIDDFNEIDFLTKQKMESQKIQEQISILQRIMPFTSTIDTQVSNLLRKQFKPKTKIYQEETHLETQHYFKNKQVSKTVFLNGPKTEHVISYESEQQIQSQQQQKQQELNTSLDYNQGTINNKNLQNYSFPNQNQQQQFAIPLQTRFVGSKTKLNESQGSSLNPANQNLLFQSRFVGVKTQHLMANKDVTVKFYIFQYRKICYFSILKLKINKIYQLQYYHKQRGIDIKLLTIDVKFRIQQYNFIKSLQFYILNNLFIHLNRINIITLFTAQITSGDLRNTPRIRKIQFEDELVFSSFSQKNINIKIKQMMIIQLNSEGNNSIKSSNQEGEEESELKYMIQNIQKLLENYLMLQINIVRNLLIQNEKKKFEFQ